MAWTVYETENCLKTAESGKGSSSINSQKAKQLVLHLWMYQQLVRKKNNGSEESRRKQCCETSTSKEQARIILHRQILNCPKRVPP